MTKRKRKAAEVKPGERFGAANNFDGKKHYPRMVYSLRDGQVVNQTVVDKAAHDLLDRLEPGVWKKQLVDLGVETCPESEAQPAVLDVPAPAPKAAAKKKGRK